MPDSPSELRQAWPNAPKGRFVCGGCGQIHAVDHDSMRCPSYRTMFLHDEDCRCEDCTFNAITGEECET